MKTASDRETRGIELFRQIGSKITFDGKFYCVPSRSGAEVYQVGLGAEPFCTCPDRVHRRNFCKHLVAVELYAAAYAERTPEEVAEMDEREWAEAVRLSETFN